MNKEKKDTQSKSLSKIAWQRLKKNNLSIFGLVLISIAILVAVLGPNIRPDNSPKANDQTLELTTKKPGFSINILKVKKNKPTEKTSWWKKFREGTESQYQNIPIYDYSFEGQKIIIEKYTGGDVNNGQIIKFDLADVVYALKQAN
ncbi:MAG: hypothetical protein GW818_04885, partial [Flavobacteriales bacterium]|nr:hypothetical protein [Flavobacteriales bacterium]